MPVIDRSKAQSVVDGLKNLLHSFYPAEAMPWFKSHRPDVVRLLGEVERETYAAAESGDRAQIVCCLAAYAQCHERALSIYNDSLKSALPEGCNAGTAVFVDGYLYVAGINPDDVVYRLAMPTGPHAWEEVSPVDVPSSLATPPAPLSSAGQDIDYPRDVA